jgi:tRNA G18 (ribose-2'-O)-methylase SpoU
MTGRRIIHIAESSDPRIEAFLNVRERDLVGRQGRFIAEGRVVLEVLVRQAPQMIESLLVLENRLQGIDALLRGLPPSAPVYCASQAVMDGVAGFHLHRGILAVARRAPPPEIASFIAALGPNALLAVLAGISNHDNMGAIFRNAAAFEADAVLIDDESCDPFYRKAIRVSVGAVLKVPHLRAGKLEAALNLLNDSGFQLAALSPRGTACQHSAKVRQARAGSGNGRAGSSGKGAANCADISNSNVGRV